MESHESTRQRTKPALQRGHEDHTAATGASSMNHYNLVHKFIPIHKAMKIPTEKAVVDKERNKLETISLTSVCLLTFLLRPTRATSMADVHATPMMLDAPRGGDETGDFVLFGGTSSRRYVWRWPPPIIKATTSPPPTLARRLMTRFLPRPVPRPLPYLYTQRQHQRTYMWHPHL